ncbi:MAG TPA: hypothetical protein VGG14_17610 [Candidatus Sulfotelmatobacter sp.]|jgi:hypothetical protein
MRIALVKTIPIALFILFCSSIAGAQTAAPAPQPEEPTRVNAFVGYSFYSTNLSTVGRASTYGWEASGEVRLYRWVGVAGDIDTHYGSQGFPICQTFPTTGYVCSTFSANIIERNFLVGPRLSIKKGNLHPFVEVLVGGAHVNAGLFQGNDNCFAAALGGGVDARLTRRLSWRLKGDYLRTQFFGARQDNGRFSTGPVFRF